MPGRAIQTSAAEPEPERPSPAESRLVFALLALQLGLFVLLVYRFDLESRAFLHLALLSVAGFSVHYFLPPRYRLPFFVALSWAGLLLVFGLQLEKVTLSGLVQGVWIIAVGLVLIGLCHLPIRFSARVALLLTAGGALAAARAGAIPVPWSSAVWPILGSLFMFRLILYLYYLKHSPERFPLSQTLAYFFLLPNVCFPLFPVVDFQTLRRTYYDTDHPHLIYQRGIHWMFRGALHLLAYRLVYYNFVLPAGEVDSVPELLHYLLWPFLLYLRISGQFHIIVGLLHLFGFHLPETHHLYFLASSFTDFWRRINIYWKDFMMRVFYYPSFFRLRKLGGDAALILATLLVFVSTWLLHSYQWFWIRGSFPLAASDAVFWGVLGVLVTVNVLWESRRGRRRVLEGRALPWGERLRRAARTIGTFLVICVLWSLWSAGSPSEWVAVWRAGTGLDQGELGRAIVGLLLVSALIGSGAVVTAGRLGSVRPSFRGSMAATLITASALIALSAPALRTALGPVAGGLVASLSRSELNRRDFALLERGYYESLLAIDRFNPELWEVYRTRPAEWRHLRDTAAVRFTDRLPFVELVPSTATRHNGVTVRTNRWGMRDRDYSRRRPDGVLRVAMLGSSFVMGSGVENDQKFEALLEERLNREQPAAGIRGYEILNFGVAGYSPLEHLAVLESRALDFEPQMVLYVAQARDTVPLLNHLSEAIERRVDHPYEFLRELAQRAGIDESVTDFAEIKRRLSPYQKELLAWVYRRIVAACRERGIAPLWIFLQRPEPHEIGKLPAEERRLAEEAGFRIVDLSGLWKGRDLSELWVARWDHHPNAKGNRLIADRLYELLARGEEPIFRQLAHEQRGAGG